MAPDLLFHPVLKTGLSDLRRPGPIGESPRSAFLHVAFVRPAGAFPRRQPTPCTASPAVGPNPDFLLGGRTSASAECRHWSGRAVRCSSCLEPLTPYRRDAAPVRPWRSVARGMPCKTGLSCRNPPAWLVASTRATILSTSFSASARSAAAVRNGAPMLLAVALRPRNVANRFFDMRGLGADDPARPKRGTPRIRINGGMYE